MLDIKQIALEVAKELLDEPLNIGQADHYIDFATRFLAAINAKAEPVAWLVRDQVDGLRYPCNQKNPAGSIDGESEPLFTHPAIEPKSAPLPDDVVVPRELLDGLCKYGHLHTVEGVAYSQGSHRELLGRASDLIAAGEVKP